MNTVERTNTDLKGLKYHVSKYRPLILTSKAKLCFSAPCSALERGWNPIRVLYLELGDTTEVIVLSNLLWQVQWAATRRYMKAAGKHLHFLPFVVVLRRDSGNLDKSLKCWTQSSTQDVRAQVKKVDYVHLIASVILRKALCSLMGLVQRCSPSL